MFEPQKLIDQVRQRLSLEIDRNPPWANRLYTLTLSLPELRLQRLLLSRQRWFYWGKPANEEYRLGIGEALRIDAKGPSRLQQLSAAFRKITTNWDRYDPDDTHSEPVIFTGFAFSPDDPMHESWQGLPNAGLFLPTILLQQTGNHCSLTCTYQSSSEVDHNKLIEEWMALFGPLIKAMALPSGPPGHRTKLPLRDSEPSRDAWIQRVEQTIQEIDKGLLEKAVLARRIRVQAERQLNPARLISTLDCLYPDSMLFATGQNHQTFVAATPERLLSCMNSEIISDAVAGTAPRAADEEKDRQLGQALLRAPKTQHEHQLVVDTIQTALRNICVTLQPTQRPKLKRLRGLQHLWTKVRGELKPGTDLFQAAAKLHPSAAVNGAPVQQAHSWLQSNESLARGWYTGAAGWIDANGNGELAVLIRCVQLKGRDAELYAGAGITAESDPQAEYEETELKFAAMLEALENA